MADDQVTIDPEFLPPPPDDGQARRLRGAGVVGVVVVAFVMGWFLRSPTPTEPELVESSTTSGTVSTVQAVTTSTTTGEPSEMIGLEVPLSEAMPGFTDMITGEEWTETGVDVVQWRPSQSAPETIASFGSDDGFAGLDASGTWYASQDQGGMLSVHRVDGVDAELREFPNLQAVGVRVANLAWHDTEPGQLAWLTCSRTPGGPGTLFRLDVADGTAEPVAVRLVDTVCSEDTWAWLVQWGDWGFFVQEVLLGETSERVLLDADGAQISQVGDDSADVWFVAGHPDGTLWTLHDSSGLRSSSFLLSPDGQSRMPVPGLADGEWLDGARWSPDGTRLALAVRPSEYDDPVVRIVDPRTAVTIAEIAESNWEIRVGAWSTDSRFLAVQRWLCPDDGCGWGEPLERDLSFYDTETGTTTMISLPVDGSWGGTVRLTDPATPAELIAHYPLDGDATDLAEYGYGGFVFGATLTSDRFGTTDAAYAFDGENDGIVITMKPQLETDTVSIAAWVQMHDTATPRAIEEWWDIVSYGGRGHVLAIQGEGAVLGGLQGTAADCAFMGSDTVFDGNWHHVAMTRDANWTIRVYLDGVVQAVTPHTLAQTETGATTDAACMTAPAFPGSVWIGADPGHREYFHGSIDDVRIYSGTLTDDEIATLAADTP